MRRRPHERYEGELERLRHREMNDWPDKVGPRLGAILDALHADEVSVGYRPPSPGSCLDNPITIDVVVAGEKRRLYESSLGGLGPALRDAEEKARALIAAAQLPEVP